MTQFELDFGQGYQPELDFGSDLYNNINKALNVEDVINWKVKITDFVKHVNGVVRESVAILLKDVITEYKETKSNKVIREAQVKLDEILENEGKILRRN